MAIKLFDYQLDAVKRMKNGCILCGGVGSGKSITSLAYYFKGEGGGLNPDKYEPMKDPPRDLYIITTARKRDTLEWDKELGVFLMSTHPEVSLYTNKVVIDSWNNIKKYSNVYGAFFIFDEQRLVGSGTWVKAFYKIAKKNKWILLSATPGDTWSDYIPVFVANGFFKNKTEFAENHIIYSRTSKFPKIDRYYGEMVLQGMRDEILVTMDFHRETNAIHETVTTEYDIRLYKDVIKTKRNPYTGFPFESPAEMYYVWRKIVNSDPDRMTKLLDILSQHPRLIIFYNFDYELEILRGGNYGPDVVVAEWNGHRHQPLPSGRRWVYLVQYTSGCEGWNCISTDTIVFYSQNYSYRITVQAAGRIDRLNTPYKELYYYHLKSHAWIDLAIGRSLLGKRDFNQSRDFTKRGIKL